MEKKITKVAKICDVCHREVGWLDKCIVCGKDYCVTCDAIMSGCIVKPDCCRECAKREDVKKIVYHFAKPIVDILKQRDSKLKKLGA